MSDTLSVAPPRARPSARHRYLTLVLECARPLARPARWPLTDVDRVDIGRGDRRSSRRERVGGDAVLALQVADARVSQQHARLVRIGGRFVLEDRGSKNGVRINDRPEARAALEDGDIIELGETFWLYREYPELHAGAGPLDLDAAPAADAELATIVPTLESAYRELATAARSPVPALVLGESGTGKELAARAIHRLSGRAGRFVAVNCGALPESLVESELFGYRRGAFSGAAEDREGLVRAADGGTLFLDEIGDLPLGSQPRLLRALQEREVHPVGATEPIPVDLRVVAASHRDLHAMAAAGTFRHDLLARLDGLRLELPPLRERREDLGLLVAAVLSSPPAAGRPRALSLDAARRLMRHSWPLNIRELEQCLRAAVAISDGDVIDAGQLRIDDGAEGSQRGVAAPRLPADQERQREELIRLIRKHAGNLTAVARELRKDRKQVRRWVDRYGIEVNRYRP